MGLWRASPRRRRSRPDWPSPEGYAQVQAVYVTVVAAYAAVADAYGAWAGTRPGTPAHAVAGQDLAERVRAATRCTHDLATLLHAHGL